MSDIDDATLDFLESDEFERMAEDLWQRALSAAGGHWNEMEDRGGVPLPEQSLAIVLTGMDDTVPREHQNEVLDAAAGFGEEMIRRAEVELAEMRRALAALQRPRSELLRSRIGLVTVVAPAS